MNELDCPLDDITLINTVIEMNGELAKSGGRTYRMHIPVDLSRDSDVLIGEVARRFCKSIETLAKYRNALETIAKRTEPLTDWGMMDLAAKALED